MATISPSVILISTPSNAVTSTLVLLYILTTPLDVITTGLFFLEETIFFLAVLAFVFFVFTNDLVVVFFFLVAIELSLSFTKLNQPDYFIIDN